MKFHLSKLNKDARVTHAFVGGLKGCYSKCEWVLMFVCVWVCVWMYCNLLAFVGDELCVDLRWLPSLCSPWLPLGRPLIKLSSKEIPSSQCMTLFQLYLRQVDGWIAWKGVSILQLIIDAEQQRADTAHTHAITLAHIDQCTLHFTLLCHFLGSWHFSAFPAFTSTTTAAAAATTITQFASNKSCLAMALFGFGFRVYFHWVRLLSTRIRPVVHPHN